jgi:thiol-disulfide isomerase/thioredoxin
LNTSPTGQRQNILAARGTPTVVSFWAPWCEACKRDFPQLNRFARADKDKVRVVAVSVEREDLAGVKAFLTRCRPDFDVLVADYSVLEMYFGQEKNIHLPSTFVFDREQLLLRLFRNEIDADRLSQVYRQSRIKAEDHRAFGVSALKEKNATFSVTSLRRAAELEGGQRHSLVAFR